MGEKQGVKTVVDMREHVLFIGVSLTGKTTLARHHANILDKANYDLVVYDPVQTTTINGSWPANAKIITSPEEFHKLVDRLQGTPDRPVFLFVDESADIFGHSETHAHWIPRRIRHQNVYLRLIAQRPKMLHPDVRTQCAVAYQLRLARDDARMICADFGHGPEVYNIQLDKGDCLLLISGSTEVEEFNVFDLVGKSRSTSQEKSS